MIIPGHTSTGSKRPEALFGAPVPELRMVRADGCRVWDADGREYLDTAMALGAVALGYGYPPVTEAAERAVREGVIGTLPPAAEEALAEQLTAVLPGVDAVRFLKTGAEAVAAAVRIARTLTGREHVLTCGYHGWLDWCQNAAGVPGPVRALRRDIPFNDGAALNRAVEEFGPLAAIVIEPVVNDAPDANWLREARALSRRHGAVLIFDEIKTAFRVAVGGCAEREQVVPDLMVVGKALGNGFPIAAVGGARPVMEAATATWISSTLATEGVSLAAALAVVRAFTTARVTDHLATSGARFIQGLAQLARAYPALVTGVRGIPQMCFLEFKDEPTSAHVARHALAERLLFKRTAYNFVSLAHDAATVDEVLARLEAALHHAADHVD